MCSKKTEDLNLRVFNMITWINESKTLTRHMSCECTYKFDGRKYNSNQKWITINVDIITKKHHTYEKIYLERCYM